MDHVDFQTPPVKTCLPQLLADNSSMVVAAHTIITLAEAARAKMSS